MNLVLFTQNTSLNSFWRGHGIKGAVFAHNQTEFLNLLKNAQIAAVEIGSVRGDKAKFITEILEQFENLKLLILANEPKFSEGKALLALGVKGYANSHMQAVHFMDAIETIKDGKIWLYPEFIQQMISELTSSYAAPAPKFTKLEELSAREYEVAGLMYKGMSNQEISEATGITLRTVKAHTASIYAKLGVKDRVGLVLFMQQKNG